jgi:hypothetical protein
MSGIPLLYVGYVTMDVLVVNKLMPTNRRARLFAMYFMRIVIIFFLWWVPALLFIFLWPNTPPWFKWVWSVWTHLQGVASALMTLLKPDIKEAFKKMLTRSLEEDWTPEFSSRGFLRRRNSGSGIAPSSSDQYSNQSSQPESTGATHNNSRQDVVSIMQEINRFSTVESSPSIQVEIEDEYGVDMDVDEDGEEKDNDVKQDGEEQIREEQEE